MSTPQVRSSEAQHALLRFVQREGKVAAGDFVRLEAVAAEKSISIAEVLEAEGIITEKDLAVLLATTLRLRLIDLTSYPFDPQLSRELKESTATRYELVPIRVEERAIEIATANPLDLDAVKAVEFATGKRVQLVVATRQEVRDALGHVYRLQESLDQFLQHVPDEQVTLNELRDDGGDLRTIAKEAELPPVVKLADIILIEGIKSRASDVHIEPGTDSVAVRYRIDGILEESFRFPKWVQNALIARLKVMAKLDITERRIPQDGRIQLRYADRIVDLRVSSLPAQHGEKITLRILDATTGIKTLDRLGFNAVDLQRMRDAIKKPEGLILVTGPTGSGKTTTLYALLREKLSPNLNIVTIENPIEYQLKGINQVEVNDKQGLTFAGVLRSVLRQDPDVIFVGEIRDKETAQIAMQASQTGHLVLSTVHTNDATAAVTRLIDLGVEPFVVASTIHLIVAQRLVRRVCQSCAEPYEPSEDARRLLRLDDAAVAQLRHGKGCAACRQTGFAGRIGVYEVLPISPAMTKLIEANASESAIRQQGRADGFPSVADSAREKLLAGLTTPEEVLRVIQVNDYAPRCPGCERDIDDDYTTCPHCGTSLRSMCSGCGKELTEGWTACPYCGTKPQVASAVTGDDGDGDGDGAAVPRRTYKALVVDDNAAIRDIVRITLERSSLGLSVVLAEDGERALALAEIERPDIVILDLQMPGIDGYEVCRRLRSDVRTAFVPVIMLTAQTAEESVTKGFAAGTDDYVTKPFRRDDLVARVRRTLERTYGKGTVGEAVPTAPVSAANPTAPHTAPVAAGQPADTVLVLEDVRRADASGVSAAADPIEARLAVLTARVEAELAALRGNLEELRAGQQRMAVDAVGPELDAIRATLEQIQENQQQVLSSLRDAGAATPAGTARAPVRGKSKASDVQRN
jgi:type IV pilus assembly protein PilB